MAGPCGEIGADDAFYLPQIGVEIVATEIRNGNRFHSIHDLRNGHVIHNVTRKGARKLWSYAIQQHEDNAVSPAAIHGKVTLVLSTPNAAQARCAMIWRYVAKMAKSASSMASPKMAWKVAGRRLCKTNRALHCSKLTSSN